MSFRLSLYGRAFLRLIYPESCPVCSRPLLSAEVGVCYWCLSVLEKLRPPLCPLCARELPPFSGLKLCGECLSRAVPVDRVWSVFGYTEPLKKLLHEAKYGARPSLLRVFREELLGFARTLAGVFDLIVPVPLERQKMRERGFNQAKILASFLAGAADAPVAELLRKVYPTPSQSLLGRAERLENLRGSFEVPCPGRVRGKSILLVDDVYTTGATVRECALILKGCGARSVSVFALARAGSSWN